MWANLKIPILSSTNFVWDSGSRFAPLPFFVLAFSTAFLEGRASRPPTIILLQINTDVRHHQHSRAFSPDSPSPHRYRRRGIKGGPVTIPPSSILVSMPEGRARSERCSVAVGAGTFCLLIIIRVRVYSRRVGFRYNRWNWKNKNRFGRCHHYSYVL